MIVLLSAASFGAVAPFARLAYDSGVNAATLMAVRYALAGLAVLGFLAWRRQPCQLRGRQLWLTLGLALFLGVTSFAYMESIRYIPVSLAALIYYTYPILVTLLAYLLGNQRLLNGEKWAHGLAFSGQALSLGGLMLLLSLSGVALDLAGILMAALSAFSFALVIVFGSRLMRSISPMVLNLYVALVNSVIFALASVLAGGFAWPAFSTGWIGLWGAVAFFIAGFLGLFAGVTLVGPSRAACLSNLEPLVTIALAVTVLGEPFNLWQIIGAGIVLFGIYTMCRQITLGEAQ